MGGGTSDFRVPPKTTKQIKDIINQAIPKAEKEPEEAEHKVRNVFISFHNEDEYAVNLLRIQSQRENTGLEFRDYSVKEPIDQWRKNVRDKIANTSATIVMIGPETYTRPNVLYEIEQSYAQGKKVIGVKVRSDKNDPIPELMLKNKAPIVNWTLKDIQDELDKP